MTTTKIQRRRNDGLRKVCGCDRRRWSTCRHPWHLNWTWQGTLYRFSLERHLGYRLATKAAARAAADEIRAAIRRGEFNQRGEPDTGPASSAPTLEKFGAVYVERSVRASGKVSWGEDKVMIGRLCAFEIEAGQRLGDRLLSAVTTDDLELFFRGLRARGRAASTCNHYRQLLRAMFSWARKKGYIDRDPAAEADLPRQKIARRTRRFAEGEETRLMAAANPRLQRLILAALETGCRRGELRRLLRRDVDLPRRRIRLLAGNTKDREQRMIPISSRLMAVLEMGRLDPAGQPLGPDAYVFGDEIGRPIKRIQTAWENACRKAGITDLHFHDLRHEAGSRRLEEGWPIHHVKELLGHADVRTTDTYLNVTWRGLEDSMRRSDRHAEALPAGKRQAKKPDDASQPPRQEDDVDGT